MSGSGLFFLLAAALHGSVQAGIVVAYESGVDAYAEAIEGMKSSLGAAPALLIDLKSLNGPLELTRALSSRDARLVVAVGSRALAEVESRKPATPVIAAMAPRSAEAANLAAQVDLDVALATQLAAVKVLLPHHTRAGMIRTAQRSGPSFESLEARARKEGFTLVGVDCDGASHLLKALAALKGRADFLLAFPDPDLYNSVTIKPLILASLEARLPIVGFSPAFVRAGAAAGIYPDYRDTGRQVAELAARVLRGEDHLAPASPAKVTVAVNQRVARLLGIEFGRAPFPVEVLH